MNDKERELFKAVERSDLNTVKQYLKDKDVNANVRGARGNNALMFSDNIEISTLLIEHGADVNNVDIFDTTPIFWATTPEMLSLLIENGANVNHLDSIRRNSLFTVNNPGCLSVLLEHGADVNNIDYVGNTLLFYAKNPEVLTMLLKEKINPNHVNKFNQVAMSTMSSLENAIILLNYGAKMTINNEPIKLIYLNSLENRKVLENYEHSLEERTFKNELNGIKEIVILKEKMGLWDALSKYIYENNNDYLKRWRKDNPEFSAINQTEIVYNEIIKKEEEQERE